MEKNQAGGPADDATKKQTGKRGKTRLLFKTVFTLSAALVVGAAVVFYLVRTEPTYWKEHQKLISESTPEQLEQLAEQVQDQLQSLATLGLDDLDSQAQTLADSLNALTDPNTYPGTPKTESQTSPSKIELEDVHINQDQTITLNNEQLAAVVQTRMDDWLTERGYVKPQELREPMIAVSDGSLVMAFQIQTEAFSQVVSGRFDLIIRKDGMAELTMDRFLIGRLPVPANAIGEHLRSSTNDDRAVRAGEWLEKLQFMQFKPVIELDHRRRARVQDYKLLEKGLELTVRVQDHKTYKAMNTALAGVAVD